MKNKNLLSTLLFLIVFINIKANSTTESVNNYFGFQKIVNNKLPEAPNGIIDKYEYLSQIFDKNDESYPEFIKYLEMINAEITSEKQIAEIFALRDKLLSYVSAKTENFYYSKGENNPVLWEKAEKELISVGFMPVYHEGMFTTLDKALILKDAIDKYASEAFKLKLKFDEQYALTTGGEYPYSFLESKFKLFKHGYELYLNHRKSDYYKEIEYKFKDILFEFVNIHKVKTRCFEGNLNFADYPWMASCDIAEKFIKQFPDNKFVPVFKKIVNNMSELNPKSLVYLIVTDEIDMEFHKGGDYDEYEKRIRSEKFNKLFNYWEKGIDVIHTVDIKNLKMRYLVYRFYSDKNKTLSEFRKIKELIPSARIVTVQVDDNEYVNVVK